MFYFDAELASYSIFDYSFMLFRSSFDMAFLHRLTLTINVNGRFPDSVS